MESVRTFANQTVTVSFWAKAGTGTPKIATELSQNFGTGGSPSTAVNTTGAAVTISTSFARYSTTIVVPSISGKTLGTTNDGYLELNLWLNAGSTFNTRASSIGNQNATFQIWGVQVEYGSKATPFQTASGGSPQAELAMCQRYYWRADGASNARIGAGRYISTTSARIVIPLKQTMRTTPSLTVSDAAQWVAGGSGGGNPTPSTLTLDTSNSDNAVLNATNTSTSIYVVTGYGTNLQSLSSGQYLEFRSEF
jgi:hypothetical protein